MAYLTLLILGACGKTVKADQERLDARVGGVLVPFVANRGQVDRAVAFYAPTFAGTAYVTRKGEIVYSLPAPAEGTRASGLVQGIPGRKGWTLTETPVGGKGRPHVGQTGEAHVSYFIGNDPARWRSGIPTYESVDLGEVWPGVSLSLRAHGDNVEKLFTVRSGANPSHIRMRVAGARSLEVNEAGALVVATGLGEVTITPPVAYQERNGMRRTVSVRYWARGQEYGFSLGGHDPAFPLVIDPLLQATYLGGGSSDSGRALAIHPTSGEVFVAGETTSTNFPGTTGGAQPTNGGSSDAFVARLNATLTTLSQATYLAGSSGDGGLALAIHPSTGDVYIAGSTSSTDFPGTVGGAQPAFGGFQDAFIARLSGSLNTLSQSTYLGGSDVDTDWALGIHPTTGEVFVAGFTFSNTNFPGTTGGAQPASAGVSDAFVARLNAALTALSQATYLGGSGGEEGRALTIHPTTGEVIVAGVTFSTNFPGTAGGAQPTSAGSAEEFVARLNGSLTTLSQSTYLGGSGVDSPSGSALAIHPTTGEVFVAGFTDSADFPGTTGGAQAANGGGGDAFLARFSATLTTLSQATYLGAGSFDTINTLAIHPTTGEVFVAGLTNSADFPATAGGAQPANGGGPDAFVARLNATLNTLNQATYLGGSGQEFGYAVAIHPTTGEVFVAGITDSTDFPDSAGGAQPASGGATDAFVARLTADLRAVAQPTPTPTPSTPTPTPTSAAPAEIPTLSPWLLGLLAVALAAIGLFLVRRTS